MPVATCSVLKRDSCHGLSASVLAARNLC